jgi:hypothetical protein
MSESHSSEDELATGGMTLEQATKCDIEGVDEMDCADKLKEAVEKVREDHDHEKIIETNIWLLKVNWNENTDDVWVAAYGYNGGYEVEQ